MSQGIAEAAGVLLLEASHIVRAAGDTWTLGECMLDSQVTPASMSHVMAWQRH